MPGVARKCAIAPRSESCDATACASAAGLSLRTGTCSSDARLGSTRLRPVGRCFTLFHNISEDCTVLDDCA